MPRIVVERPTVTVRPARTTHQAPRRPATATATATQTTSTVASTASPRSGSARRATPKGVNHDDATATATPATAPSPPMRPPASAPPAARPAPVTPRVPRVRRSPATESASRRRSWWRIAAPTSAARSPAITSATASVRRMRFTPLVTSAWSSRSRLLKPSSSPCARNAGRPSVPSRSQTAAVLSWVATRSGCASMNPGMAARKLSVRPPTVGNSLAAATTAVTRIGTSPASVASVTSSPGPRPSRSAVTAVTTTSSLDAGSGNRPSRTFSRPPAVAEPRMRGAAWSKVSG